MSVDSLSFGKYKNVPISKIPSSYLLWLRKSSKETVDDLEEELWRRGEFEPETPIPAPAHLSERAQAMLRYVIDNLAGKPRSSIFNMFSGGMFGTYAEAQAAWTEILGSGIPIGSVFSEEPPEDESGDLMVLSKAHVEELIAHAMTSGYNSAYDRLSVNVKALPYAPAFKDELLASLIENRPIDVTKFKDEQKTSEKPIGDNGSGEKKNKRPWYAEDHRK